LGQLVPRLAAVEDRELKKVDGFADVRLGFNVLMLQKERARLGASSAFAIGAVLSGISHFYRARLKAGQPLGAPDDLRQSIDESLRVVADENAGSGRDSLDALVGLRRALYPQAPPPENWRSNQPVSIPLSLAAE
jgi:hypothetical protein